MLNEDAKAETVFREAARLRPDLRDAHLNVAFSLIYQGRLRESVTPFLAARRLVPGDRVVDENLMTVVLSILQDEPGGGPRSYPQLDALAAEPLVSVVIPTRDRPRMLRDALESVARQTYRNWEAIVVNDGGAEVASVVRSLAPQAAARTTVVDDSVSQGAARSRNRAIRAAKGAVLAFLDDDDMFLPDHLATLVEAMAPSGAPVVYTESEAVEERIEEGHRVEMRRGKTHQYRFSRGLLLVRNIIPIANWGIRRECFERWGGFDYDLACVEDWDLLLRFSAQTPFLRVARTTTEIRVRVGTRDSVTQRIPMRPTCELLYRRYPAGTSELIALGREVYLASVT